MPEPAFTVDRYGGTYSWTIEPVPWWHWRALLHPLRARRARRKYAERMVAEVEVGPGPFLLASDWGPLPEPVGVGPIEGYRALYGSFDPAVPCFSCCGGVKAFGHEPDCTDEMRRAAPGRIES